MFENIFTAFGSDALLALDEAGKKAFGDLSVCHQLAVF